jgi:hypothetical protein
VAFDEEVEGGLVAVEEAAHEGLVLAFAEAGGGGGAGLGGGE